MIVLNMLGMKNCSTIVAKSLKAGKSMVNRRHADDLALIILLKIEDAALPVQRTKRTFTT